MEEQRNRLRPWRPPQRSAHPQGVLFSLPFFDVSGVFTLRRAKPDDTAAERRSISASRNAFAIIVILKAAMASSPQIARASCTSSSIAPAEVGDAFVRVLTRGSPMYSADNWKIRAVFRSATHARRMQTDQLRGAHTIPPTRSGRQASSRRPCFHKESAVASRLPNLAGRTSTGQHRRQLCVSETFLSAPPIEAQLNQPACRQNCDRACVCAWTQSLVPNLCGLRRFSPRVKTHSRRNVRDRLFRIPGLPG
jgi:hypothetical protein